MTLTLELPNQIERALAEQAAREGKTVEAVAIEAIGHRVLSARTWEQVSAPFAKAFDESGMTEAELDALIEGAREEAYFEQHGRHSKQKP